MSDQTFDLPTDGGQESAAMPAAPNFPVTQDAEAKAVAAAMRLGGVEGAGIGQDSHGVRVVIVYLADEAARAALPANIAGLPVQAQVTGAIRAGG